MGVEKTSTAVVPLVVLAFIGLPLLWVLRKEVVTWILTLARRHYALFTGRCNHATDECNC